MYGIWNVLHIYIYIFTPYINIYIWGLGVVDEHDRLHFVELCAGSHCMTDAMIEFDIESFAYDALWFQI